jgi:hypothetical protein
VNAVETYDGELLTPPPAQSDDGNPWVDGWCWLWCGWQYTRVLWIGAVGTPGANAPLYACGACIRLLSESVWDYADAQNELPRDEWGRDIPLYRSATEEQSALVRFRRGRHRRPRTPLGERFFNAITAPDDRPTDPPLPAGQPRESAPSRAAARWEAGLHPPCQQPRPGDSAAVATLASVR